MSTRRQRIQSEIVAIAVTLFLVTAARSSLADHYYVPTGSMEYSLLPGDRVFVDKTAYGLRVPLTKIDLVGASSPERGDVVVFDSPLDGERLIKRIVALEGDEVTLLNGHLTINGEPLSVGDMEDFGRALAHLNLEDGGGPDIEALTIPPHQVLALGDHRGDSADGRYFGLIDERDIFGRAVGIYYRRGEGLVWMPL